MPCTSSGALKVTTEAGKGTNEDTAQQLEQLTALGIVRELHSTAICPRCNTAIKREAAHICTNCRKPFHVRCLRKKRDGSRKQTHIENRQYVHSGICNCCHSANVIAASQPDAIKPMGMTYLELSLERFICVCGLQYIQFYYAHTTMLLVLSETASFSKGILQQRRPPAAQTEALKHVCRLADGFRPARSQN